MHWGTKIVIGMALFMLFIIGMVIYMFHIHGRDALVDDHYYESGMHYDQEYAAKKNVMVENVEPDIVLTKTQMILFLKNQAVYELTLMRPDDQHADIHLKGVTVGDKHMIAIHRTNLSKGLWSLSLKWTGGSKAYWFKKDLML